MVPKATQITEHDGARLREELDATTQAVAAAHSTPVVDANTGVRWERRGLLQRLVRAPRD